MPRLPMVVTMLAGAELRAVYSRVPHPPTDTLSNRFNCEPVPNDSRHQGSRDVCDRGVQLVVQADVTHRIIWARTLARYPAWRLLV